MFLARSRRNRAASFIEVVGPIQPNMEVPPMEVMTMRFFISTLPIFQGVKSGS